MKKEIKNLINRISIKVFFTQLLAVLFILSVIFYPSAKTPKNDNTPIIKSDTSAENAYQLTDDFPFVNFHVYYWDFTNDYSDSFNAGEEGFTKRNFLIVTDPQGSGSYIYDVKLFQNAKLIFSKEDLYQGDAFFDIKNNFLD